MYARDPSSFSLKRENFSSSIERTEEKLIYLKSSAPISSQDKAGKVPEMSYSDDFHNILYFKILL